WFLQRLAPESPAYNLPMALRCLGDLSVPALAASLAGTVRRHEVLRTTYEEIDGEPVQRIARPEMAASIARISTVDLAALADPAARSVETERLAFAEARRPFDLARG